MVRYSIRGLLLLTLLTAVMTVLALTFLSKDDSAFIRAACELKGKTVAEYRQFATANEREYGVLLDGPTSTSGFQFNGYIVATHDGRTVKLSISPRVVSPDGMFSQSELDKCRITKVEILGQKKAR